MSPEQPSSSNNLEREICGMKDSVPKTSQQATNPIKSDIRKEKAFQAYLASKKERSEVYRRLAES